MLLSKGLCGTIRLTHLHTVRCVFLIITQELPKTDQLDTQIGISPVGLGLASSVDGSRLELPSRLSSIHTQNEGREERWVMVVNRRFVMTEGFLLRPLSLSGPGT